MGMELLALRGAHLVRDPRPVRDEPPVYSAHDHHNGCNLFANRVSLVGRRRRGGSSRGSRKIFEARGYSVQDGYNSAPETAHSSGNRGNTIIRRDVSRLAMEDDFVSKETLQPRDRFTAPGQTGGEGILRYSRTSYDGDDYARTKLRLSQQKPIENVRSGVPSTLTNIAHIAFPLLLIAPVIGFIARCVVDYIHTQIENEVGKRFAEMESWQALQRPRVKRWQTILDEDRDENELELLTTSISNYQYQSDPWTSNSYQPTTSRDDSETNGRYQIPPGKETEEERKLRQKYDYEEIKRSYTKLEPMYEKFLADSGLTGSGYWRGAGES